MPEQPAQGTGGWDEIVRERVSRLLEGIRSFDPLGVNQGIRTLDQGRREIGQRLLGDQTYQTLNTLADTAASLPLVGGTVIKFPGSPPVASSTRPRSILKGVGRKIPFVSKAEKVAKEERVLRPFREDWARKTAAFKKGDRVQPVGGGRWGVYDDADDTILYFESEQEARQALQRQVERKLLKPTVARATNDDMERIRTALATGPEPPRPRPPNRPANAVPSIRDAVWEKLIAASEELNKFKPIGRDWPQPGDPSFTAYEQARQRYQEIEAQWDSIRGTVR